MTSLLARAVRALVPAAALAALASTGAACSSSSSPSGSGGSGGDATSQACDLSFEAEYRDLYTCAGVDLPADHRAALKASYGKYCAAQLTEAGRTATAAHLTACAQAHQAAPCGTLTTLDACRIDSLPGTLAVGAGCFDDAQCASLYCAIDSAADVSCGHCTNRLADGAACDHASDRCAIGDACDPQTSKCEKATPAAPLGAGEGCVVSVQCQPDLGCIANKCAPRIAEGGACPNGDECKQELGCDVTTSKCTKRSVAKPGEACDVSVVLCETGNCASGSDGKGTCPKVIADGAACAAGDAAQTCLELSVCIDGKCAPLDPSICK